ncbi:chemotaxis protein CheA [Rubellimicrobium arenae]|uniref:chemotaxis protein CheA n=1 Tax=Rubellimicrobium arenae TaxID=2817372 RepID=UPI001B30AFD6|nr:chemotaxis protein CheA [Rubellimicrobium arenae]
MSPLDEQFLIECRELTAQAAEDIVALERDPGDIGRLDRLFRVVHTLKGSAAVMELAPMSRLMHASEDWLGSWRGQERLPAGAIDRVLAILDQTESWLGHFEAEGRLPEDASATADRLLEGTGSHGGASPVGPIPEAPPWAQEMLDDLTDIPAGPIVALDYEPRPGCFFDGDDPLDLVRRLPGLLAVSVVPRDPWPPIEQTDPFTCNLRIRALAAADPGTARDLVRLVADQARIAVVEPAPERATSADVLLNAILAEQGLLLRTPAEPGDLLGRLASAARSAVNALRHAGAGERADRIDAAGAAALAQKDPRPLLAALEEPWSAGPAGSEAPAPTGASPATRVDSARIDRLADLAGEIAVARNGLSHLLGRASGDMAASDLLKQLAERDAELGRLTVVLQRAVADLRLMPVGPVFRRFPRLVRETARSLGKQVLLDMSGEGTEVDRTIVESIHEPLLHLLRNALDHGIEPPEERRAAGKPPEGRITLRAAPDGDRVAIEVGDDGRGIDPAALRRRAVRQGVVTEAAALAMSDEEAVQLVLRSGVSTAARVSDLSGRGVGMDVVRDAVERVGGTLQILNRPGKGTTFRLLLPISMTVTRVMVVRAGTERFGLPMDRALQTVRIPRERIHPIRSGAAFVLRDRTVPLVGLADLLGLTGVTGGDQALVVVLATRSGPVGFEVDGIEDRLDAPMRPPEGLLANMPHLLGTTVRGDGQVLLVLEPEALLP